MKKLTMMLIMLAFSCSATVSPTIVKEDVKFSKKIKIYTDKCCKGLILPAGEFERFVLSNMESIGVEKINTSGASVDEFYFITEVDHSRYLNKFDELLIGVSGEHVKRSINLEPLMKHLSPSIDLNHQTYLALINYDSISYLVISGPNMRDNGKFVHEIYYKFRGNLLSLTYFTDFRFEDLFITKN